MKVFTSLTCDFSSIPPINTNNTRRGCKSETAHSIDEPLKKRRLVHYINSFSVNCSKTVQTSYEENLDLKITAQKTIAPYKKQKRFWRVFGSLFWVVFVG
jgi:hypothetical protein